MSQPVPIVYHRKDTSMPKNFSFTIYPVRDRKGLTGQFKCMYRRGFYGHWHIYKQGKKEECVGIAIAKYCDWGSSIFQVMFAALEDANFHGQNETVEQWIKEFEK